MDPQRPPYQGYADQPQWTLGAVLNARLNVIGDVRPHFREANGLREAFLRARAQRLQEEIRTLQHVQDSRHQGWLRTTVQQLVHDGRGLIVAASCALIAGAVACVAGVALRIGNQTTV